MTISIWRYSHLALAISSFLLLSLASVTGIILAFQPLAEKIQPYRADQFDDVTLAQSLPALRKIYPGISELTVDANQFVQIKGSDAHGNNLLAYVHPRTGEILGVPAESNEFFLWVTALHRSLFIHETGRFFIGLTAFLLILITISGAILVIQRQRGVKRFFTRIVRDNFAQYYHVVLGRLSLIPIFIIAVSGTYLSLERFGLVGDPIDHSEIDVDAIRAAPIIDAANFPIFKNTKFTQVQSVEFPFSEDVEDYYTLKLNDREITVNQITGDILSTEIYPTTVLLTKFSLDLHTGRASAVWAILLALATGNILFFIYSGFTITLKRRVKNVKNKFSVRDSRFIILVGSENGGTFRFAQSIHQQLLERGESSFLGELNQYTSFPRADHLIIITATYGLGEAPTNATKFLKLLVQHKQSRAMHYSVLGFGSYAYPDFCQFAFEVNHVLAQQDWATPLIDVHTVSDKSPDEFNLWVEAWSQQAGIPITILPKLYESPSHTFETLTVTENTIASGQDTFLIRFRSMGDTPVTSGDLLVIYPENDHRERMYSIGVIEKEIQLSVRLYPHGLGSGYLQRLTSGQTIHARVVDNEHFHFPKEAREVMMISNGTGIAPFLGMISQNVEKVSCVLYCGFREHSSYHRYQHFLETQMACQHLVHVHTAFSREGEKQYVSTLILRDTERVTSLLSRGGVIMICGSLAMQKDIIELLDQQCLQTLNKGVSFFQSHKQIRTDCY